MKCLPTSQTVPGLFVQWTSRITDYLYHHWNIRTKDDLYVFVAWTICTVPSLDNSYHTYFITSAEEGGYVFTSVCLSVRRITEKVVNGF